METNLEIYKNFEHGAHPSCFRLDGARRCHLSSDIFLAFQFFIAATNAKPVEVPCWDVQDVAWAGQTQEVWVGLANWVGITQISIGTLLYGGQ